VEFAHRTVQESLIAFAMPTEQTDFPGIEDPGNVVSLLEQEAISVIEDDCWREFAPKWICHIRPLLLRLEPEFESNLVVLQRQ
jgi:hypothetical protein